MIVCRSVKLLLVLIALAASTGCADGRSREAEPAASRQTPPPRLENAIRTGSDVLADEQFARLSGKRIGLIANHTTLVDTTHLGDLMQQAPGVELVALFGPEHGVRGTAEAGAEIRGGRDVRTGVPVHSLYGRTNKPTSEMLREVDVLVFDVQDVGARFYTYISTMGLAMQAAAEHGIPFVVLDRPNPIGGEYVSGFLMEPQFESFVGLFPIPIAHGLTVAELALMIKGEAMLPGLENLELEIVPMEGWNRAMLWDETGLPWIAPSPNLPTLESALVYAGTCLFEALNASEGRGTSEPFLQLGAPYVDGATLTEDLNGRSIDGADFESVTFEPRSITGMSSNPRFRGRMLEGVRIRVRDEKTFRPVETAIHLIDAFRIQAEAESAEIIQRRDWLARLAGTGQLAELLDRSASPEEIIEQWQDDVAAFSERRRPYLLYD